MNMTTTTRESILGTIQSTKGKFFTVTFIKKDKTIRKMNARLGVTKHLRGGESTTKDKQHLITVFDMTKKEYRSVNLDTVLSVSCNGKRFDYR